MKCIQAIRRYSQTVVPDGSIKLHGQVYKIDKHHNVTPSIIAKMDMKLHLNKSHPIGILNEKIKSILPEFAYLSPLNPVVSTWDNFDALLIEKDHPSRLPSDTYHINENQVLRTHTSAHQSEVLKGGSRSYLVTADVYRRDEVDPTHYPVFHQMEGIYTWTASQLEQAHAERELDNRTETALAVNDTSAENPIQKCHSTKDAQLVGAHLRETLEHLMRTLLRDPSLKIRWIDAYFPFTSPSWEMEVYYNDAWLEVLGCGVIQQKILDASGNSDKIGWAFGLGLERIAMVMFGIPDIRLFWSTDPRFTSQFSPGVINKFVSFSKYPLCYKDISFWVPTGFSETDIADTVRNEAGDLAESVKLVLTV
jgi:phenylalanyl-tRNA synthetase alpha chain